MKQLSVRLVLSVLAAFAISTTGSTWAQPGMPPEAISKPMTLEESQLQGFLAAVTDLKALGTEAGGWQANMGRPEALMRGLQLSSAAQAVLQKHGIQDVTEFQRIGYNAAMAYGVLQNGGKASMAKDLAKAKAEQAKALEQMRQHLSPEQLKALESQMNAGMAMAGSLQDVPEANLELVKKYRTQMDSLSDKGAKYGAVAE